MFPSISCALHNWISCACFANPHFFCKSILGNAIFFDVFFLDEFSSVFYNLKDRSLCIVYKIHADFLTQQQARASGVSGGPGRLSLRRICVYPTQPYLRERNLCSHNFLLFTAPLLLPPHISKMDWIWCERCA